MPTTSNFGWTTPADTDLVKDGAAAIRTLGNGIDTSFIDLKGGSSGQVLAKNSNTDLDFVWVAQDDSNAIQNAIVDAKGDLISASAADTPARLAVGANGTILTADSSQSTGLKWAAPSSADKGMTLISNVTTTGVSTIQVTGLGSYDDIVIQAQWTPTSFAFGRVRLNNNSGSIYRVKQTRFIRNTSNDLTQNYMEPLALENAMAGYNSATEATQGGSGGASNPTNNMRIVVSGLKSTTGYKYFRATQQLWNGSLDIFYENDGIFESTTAVTTLDFVLSAGNFGSTDIRVYGAA